MQPLNPATWPADTPVVRVGDLCVDLRYRRLCTAEGEVELSSRVFDVLLLFLAEPNRLHTRESLLERIWAGVVVEDGNLTQTVSVLRRLLGEERKLWIRTVAKRGYVFEPPGPVMPLELDDEGLRLAGGDVVSAPAASVPSAPTIAAPATTHSRRRTLRWVAAAAVVFGLAISWFAASTPALGRRIALLPLDDPGAGADTRWPATVLQSWLEWQLSLAPEVIVLSAADLAADASDGSGVEVVLLSATPAGAGRLRLQARTPSGANREAEGPLESVDELIDQVSQAVLTDLLPQRAREARPALQLSAENAQRYAQAVQHHRQREWTPYLERLRGVVEQEPEFGLARLQLAQSLLTFGQYRAADEHFARLQSAAGDWPDDARALLAAQRLVVAQRHGEAAQAFAALAQRYPNQAQFVLDEARARLRAGHAADTIALLSAPRWQRQPVALRIMAQLNLSAAYGNLGDASNARTAALAAQQLAQDAGWNYEGAMAAQAVTIADWMQGEGPAIAARFDAVAGLYDSAGDPLRAHLMRFYADLADPQREPTHLPALLTAARASGHQAIEFEALRRASYKFHRLGDFAAYRQYLDQAASLAAASGAHTQLQSISFDRINEDYLRGDLSAALRHAEALRPQPGKDGLDTNLDVLISLIHLRQGRFAASQAVLERADPQGTIVDKALRREAPEIAFSLACLRGTLALLRGETAAAEADFSRCANSVDPSVGLFGRLGGAELALLGGDRGRAATPLNDVQAGLGNIPGLVARWSLSLEWATQAARHGDAAQVRRDIEALLAPIQDSGYRLLELDARLSLAEASLVLGEPLQAARELTAARALLVADDWLGRRRLDIASAGLALAQGRADDAAGYALPLHAAAVESGDVATELTAHDLLQRAGRASPCSESQHVELLTKSGMRGATLAWLLPPALRRDLARTWR